MPPSRHLKQEPGKHVLDITMAVNILFILTVWIIQRFMFMYAWNLNIILYVFVCKRSLVQNTLADLCKIKAINYY